MNESSVQKITSSTGFQMMPVQVFRSSSALAASRGENKHLSLKGAIVIGTVQAGKVQVGDIVQLGDQTDKVSTIEINKARVSEAVAGQRIGIGFRNLGAAQAAKALGMPSLKEGLWSNE